MSDFSNNFDINTPDSPNRVIEKAAFVISNSLIHLEDKFGPKLHKKINDECNLLKAIGREMRDHIYIIKGYIPKPQEETSTAYTNYKRSLKFSKNVISFIHEKFTRLESQLDPTDKEYNRKKRRYKETSDKIAGFKDELVNGGIILSPDNFKSNPNSFDTLLEIYSSSNGNSIIEFSRQIKEKWNLNVDREIAEAFGISLGMYKNILNNGVNVGIDTASNISRKHYDNDREEKIFRTFLGNKITTAIDDNPDNIPKTQQTSTGFIISNKRKEENIESSQHAETTDIDDIISQFKDDFQSRKKTVAATSTGQLTPTLMASRKFNDGKRYSLAIKMGPEMHNFTYDFGDNDATLIRRKFIQALVENSIEYKPDNLRFPSSGNNCRISRY